MRAMVLIAAEPLPSTAIHGLMPGIHASRISLTKAKTWMAGRRARPKSHAMTTDDDPSSTDLY